MLTYELGSTMGRRGCVGRRRRTTVLFAHALAVAIVSSACQPAEVEFRTPPDEPGTFGQLVYTVAKENAARAESCPGEMSLVLNQYRDDLIEGVDRTVDEQIIGELPALFDGALLPRVDDGELPAFTDALAGTVALLVDDEFDPERKALGGFAALANSRSVLQDAHILSFARELLADPDVAERIHALLGLARETDRNDYAINSAMRLVSGLLSSVSEPGTCEGLEVRNIDETLLRTVGFEDAPMLGQAAWVARVDMHGNPLVRTNTATGDLYDPFVDRDADGAADVDADGNPVDSNDQPIELAPFGYGNEYDAAGRRLAPDGSLLYDYYDAKRTALSHVLRLAREALDAGIHRDIAVVMDAALGEQQPCTADNDDGSGNCFAYSADDNPVNDLVFTLLEVAKYDRPVVFLESWNALLRDNPELADRVLVAVGRLAGALENSDIDFLDPGLFDLVDQLLPLMADVFGTDAGGGASTPRVLMQVIHELGQTSRDFPNELRVTIDYRTLIKDNECSAEPIDPMSPRVDYDLPRYYQDADGNTIDNRSSLEQSVELLVDADCSMWILGGSSMTELLLNVMSEMSPDTVCGLIDTLLNILDFTGSLGDGLLRIFLAGAGCENAAKVVDGLHALDDLARSGALDFYLPLAKVFKDKQQLGLLIDIIGVLVADLRADEDGSSETSSVVRPLLPVLSEVIESGAADALFDLDDLLVTIPASDGSGTLADVIIDSGVRLLDDTGTVMTPHGPVQGTSLAAEMIRPLRTLVTRMDTPAARDSLGNVARHLIGYLTRTTILDNGTPDPSDDVEVLADRSLVPLLSIVLEVATDAADLPRDDYLCYLSSWQEGAQDVITGPSFAALIRLGLLLGTYERTPELEQWISHLLEPAGLPGQPEPFVPLMQITSEVVQSPHQIAGLTDVVDFAATAIDPARLDSLDLLEFVDEVLVTDTNQTMIHILQNLVDYDLQAGVRAPLYLLLDTVVSLTSIDPDNTCQPTEAGAVTVADLESTVDSVLDFIGDDKHGLSAIFRLLELRTRRN